MTKPEGAAPGAVGAAGAADAGDEGACAVRLVSHTSFGRTVANSRSTRSHDTRRESAEVTADTRAFCSSASPASIAVCAFGSGGSSASCAFASPRAFRLSFTDALAPRNMTERTTKTTSRRPSPTKIGACSAVVRFALSSRGRRLAARMSVVDPEADGDGERAHRLGGLEPLAGLHADERVAAPDADADQPLGLFGRAVERRRPAGEHDLADSERAGLALIELERGDELAREGLDLAPHRRSRHLRLLVGQALRSGRTRKRECALDRLRLGRGQVERLRDGGVEGVAAPLEDPRELAHGSVRDGERRTVVTDRDGDERRLLGGARLGQRAQERECLEVDPDDGQPGLAARGQVAVDELAVGDDEKDAADPLPLLGLRLAEDAVVENGLLDRDRERLLGAEADRVRELLRVDDADDVERAHADPVVGDAEADAAARELVLAEEGLQRLGERLRVAELAADDHPGVERLAGELEELRLAVVRDAGGGQPGRADLEADQALRRLPGCGLR